MIPLSVWLVGLLSVVVLVFLLVLLFAPHLVADVRPIGTARR